MYHAQHFHFNFFLQFKVHAAAYYQLMCEVIMFDLKLEMRSTLRKFFSRTGLVCHISNSQHSDLVSITQGLHTSPLFFHCNTYILTCSALKVLSFKKCIQNFLIAFTTSENCIYVLKIYPSIHQFLEPSKNLMILLFHKYMYDFLE